jgi:hypothetical protein
VGKTRRQIDRKKGRKTMFLKFYNKADSLPDTCVIECDGYTRALYQDERKWHADTIEFYAPFGLEYGAGDVEFPKDGITVFEIFREQDDLMDRMIICQTIAIVDFNLYVENIDGKTVDRYTG